ncbi:MAG: envelope stress response membrane protein PspB [Sphingomonadaceae bacterium]
MHPTEALIPLSAILALFIGLPWLIFHYITKWKQAKSITVEDEDLLDELHELARRLDDRMTTIERIIAADQGADRALAAPADTQRIAEMRPRSLGKDL